MIYHNSPSTHLNRNLAGLSTSATIAVQQLCRPLQKKGRKIYRLGLGQSPFPVPESVVRALPRFAQEKKH